MTDGGMDGRTDGGNCNIPDAFLKKRGDNNRYYVALLQKNSLISPSLRLGSHFGQTQCWPTSSYYVIDAHAHLHLNGFSCNL